MAFACALERGYKGVITIDGNNKDDPTAIPQFIERMEAGFDHIQGSRWIPGGITENLPTSRYLGLKLLHAPLISLYRRARALGLGDHDRAPRAVGDEDDTGHRRAGR